MSEATSGTTLTSPPVAALIRATLADQSRDAAAPIECTVTAIPQIHLTGRTATFSHEDHVYQALPKSHSLSQGYPSCLVDDSSRQIGPELIYSSPLP